VSTEITQLVSDLVVRMKSGSTATFREGLARLGEAARAGGPERLTAVVSALAPVLPGLGGDFAKAAVLAGACVEWGGSPLPLLEVLPERAAEVMMLNALVEEWWTGAGTGLPLPEPTRGGAERLERVFAPYVRPGGALTAGNLRRIAMSWDDMDDWLRALLTVLARGEFRDALPAAMKASLRERAAAVAGRSQQAAWVADLAAVLDDEPLLVLAPESGRGYALTMRGIGDNAQLYILLADRLIGDPAAGLLPGRRPEPSWVAAATDADPHLGPDNAAIRAFRLFDGHGRYVAPEGRPADIGPLDGVRVLLIHPPNGNYGMGSGHVFTAMRPTLTLDRPLGPSDTENWLARVAPAVEDDLMAQRMPPR
jgi:hypothetical protein